MSYIKKIVDYFFHHDLPEEMNWKIHRRLLKKEDRPEVDEALQSVCSSYVIKIVKQLHRFEYVLIYNDRWKKRCTQSIVKLFQITCDFFIVSYFR